MKHIVLTVISILVFTANCRDLADGRNISDDGRNLSDGRDHPDDLDLSNGYDHSDGRDLSTGHALSNSRNLPDSRATSNDQALSNDLSKGGDLSDVRGLSSSSDLYYGKYLPNVPNDEASTNDPVIFSDGPMDIAFSTEDADVGVPIVKVGPGAVQGGFDNNDPSFVDHQLKKDGRVQNGRKLRGGSKCKSDIVCSLLGGSCVTNATYCSGREVPSVCNGAKCKCCIPVTLEVKIHDLETELRSMMVNLTIANSNLQNSISNLTITNSDMDNKIESLTSNFTNASENLESKLDSISDTQGTIEAMSDNLKQELQSLKINMNISELNINTELQSLKNDISTSDSNLNTELQSLKNYINTSDSNLNTELQSLNNYINTSDSNLNTELQSLKITMNTSFSNMNSKVENQGCPEGLFYFAPSNQCFRVLNDTTRNYDSAKSACSALGLQLAQPYDPVTLRSYLVTKYGRGIGSFTWLGARGDGSHIRWQRNGQYISSTNPLWGSGYPGSYVRTTDCLWLQTYEGAWKSQPNQPYRSYSCSYSGPSWALCELVRE